MSLKDKYIEYNSHNDFRTQYSETATSKFGKIFGFQNTNYRLLTSFVTNYFTFKNGADGVDRAEWEVNPNHGQETLKQHVVNMIKSRFFSKNERTYYKTRKGEIIDCIPDNFEEPEKWIILYFLLIDAYFEDIPNYILRKSKDAFENFLVYINDAEQTFTIIKNFINTASDKSIEELFLEDYLYLDTFHIPYKNYDFLSDYFGSEESERNELKKYIVSNCREYKELTSKAKNRDDTISATAKAVLMDINYDCINKKYQPGGVFTKNMLIDNAKMLFLSSFINNNTFRDFRDFIHRVIAEYLTIAKIDRGKVVNFIFQNKDVFELCYINIFEPDFLDNVSAADGLTPDQEEDILSNAQEKSIVENVEEITKISSVLKKKALERADYKCELEEFCNCAPHYFTNKKNGKNYVELHHFIPREFSNDFEKSIEQIENYVSLCPRCHRFVHFAADRERVMVLNHLYKKRHGSLKMKGIIIEDEQLKNYYRIEM